MNKNRRVYVTGIGVISPVGLDTESTWASVSEGKSGIDLITAFDSESFDTKFAAEVKGFDPESYLERKDARRMDRFAQFAAAAAQEACRQAQLNPQQIDPYKVGVIIGSGIGGIITLSQQFEVLSERGPKRVSPFLIPMMLADMASAQVSMVTGAMGANYCTVSSCSSGADALGQGWEMIVRGQEDIVLAGGSEAPIYPVAVAGFNALRALSRFNEDPKRASRPFDLQRDGFVMGEGSAVLVLESGESLERRGVPPLAELKGYAATSDAHHITEPGPTGESAARAMKTALSVAGVDPSEVDYLNAHGTSTPLNDALETVAIKRLFGDLAYKIPISSTKSMIGHSLGAAGSLDAAACVKTITEGMIHPTVNQEEPDPDCDLDYVPNQARSVNVEVALSNAFGFGGQNACLVFRQYFE